MTHAVTSTCLPIKSSKLMDVIKARAIYMLEMKNAKDLSKTYIKKNV
jgi:hypothetical protein